MSAAGSERAVSRRPRALPLPDPAAHAALSAGGVAGELADRLAIYAALVLAGNRRFNLTGAKDGAAFAAHIFDALTLRGDVVGPLVDVGSGNGLPGIPLAVATGARVLLVEPIKKRARFLRDTLEILGLAGSVVDLRAEDAARDPAYREQFRTATARAVASASAVAELTLPFLAIGGRALLQRGSLAELERDAVADAALVLGGVFIEERAVDGERRIVVLEKRTTTSPRFPRKNGVPAKRPLCLG